MRYVKVTLIIGFLTALLVAGLFELGAFRQLDQGLGNFLGLRFSPVSSRLTQYPLILLFSFGIAWATVDIARNSLKVVIMVGALAEIVSAAWILNLMGLFFSPFASVLSITVAGLAGLIYAQTEPGSRKRIIRAIFGDRISAKTFHALIDSDVPLHFEGELHEITVVICEIFNHEHLANSLPVTDYVAMNNSFLRNAGEFLVEHGGYLDECDGESLRVIFGAPLPDSRHAATACEAVLGLVSRLDAVNAECLRVWGQSFDFRIGINSGDMVAAAYGSRRLGAFSVAGEAVEWARRLCAANLVYGSRVLIGAQTYQLAETDVEVRPLDLTARHPGEGLREEVYELLARKHALSGEALRRRDLFWTGVIRFRERRWDEALDQFRLAWSPQEHDAPIEFYVRRIEQLRDGASALELEAPRV